VGGRGAGAPSCLTLQSKICYRKPQDGSENAVESIGCIQDGCLIGEAQGGNQAAFGQLMQTYDQAVLQLALRLTRSKRDAQEIYRG
jgi:hypothetical protein